VLASVGNGVDDGLSGAPSGMKSCGSGGNNVSFGVSGGSVPGSVGNRVHPLCRRRRRVR